MSESTEIVITKSDRRKFDIHDFFNKRSTMINSIDEFVETYYSKDDEMKQVVDDFYKFVLNRI